MPGNTLFYERSMRLWENLSQDLNYNVMISQRGQYNLCHSSGQIDAARRRGNIMCANGIDAELFDREEVRRRLPYLDYSKTARFPIHGAIFQCRASAARHDAVACGYAVGADRHGVDIMQQREVTGYLWDDGRIVGVQTNRGDIRANKVALPDKLLLEGSGDLTPHASEDLIVLDLGAAITLEGTVSRDLLGQLIAIDTSHTAFEPGAFVQTGLHHVGVLIHCTVPYSFDILVPGTWQNLSGRFCSTTPYSMA